MKNFKIYQLPVENKAKYMDYEFVTENGIMPALADYNMVYESEADDSTTLDDLFRKFNVAHPADFKGHSLSVSDIVEMDGKYYYCDDYGWEEVTFPAANEKKVYIVTANGVTFKDCYKTREEAQKRADELNDEYYMHKVWNVEEVIDEVTEEPAPTIKFSADDVPQEELTGSCTPSHLAEIRSMVTKEEKFYHDIKAKYPEAIIMLRCGDFYETWYEDAKYLSKVCGTTLTHKNNKPVAAFPHMALDIYLPRLVRSGARIAICDHYNENEWK